MPKYRFQSKSGVVTTITMPASEFERRVRRGRLRLENKLAGGFETLILVGMAKTSTTGNASARYPMVSDAMGVHPSQIKEHMDHLRKMGCGQVDHTPDGGVILNDNSQRRRVAEALGMYDRNGGYSDPAPRYRTSCKRYR